LTQVSQDSLAALDKLVKKMPIVDDILFWIVVNAFVLAYVGAWQLVFHSGPSLVLSALAVVAAALYVLLARRRFAKPEPWTAQVCIALPALILLGDLIVTGGATAFGVLIAVSSLLLIFYTYRTLRGKDLT